MEATAGTAVTTVLEHDVEESEYLILTQSSTEVQSETSEEGCEPYEDHSTSYPDNRTVYEDARLYGNSDEELEPEYDDDYNEDEGTAYDETEAYGKSYERDEVIECEEEGEASENINEEYGATRLPVAGFNKNCSHEAYWSGENEQASHKPWPEISDDDWSTPALDPERSYAYVEVLYFLSSSSDVRYALLRHMINVFEASFHRLGDHQFGEDLKSEKWRREILIDDGVGRLANLSWDQVHAVEVKDWIKFLERVRDANLLPEDALANPETFSPPNLNPAFQILRMASYIRNRTFHREEPVIESQLRTALLIPRVLKDGKRAEELEAIYEVIKMDPTLDASSSQWVREILFPPQPESGTCLEVHAKFLGILEEGSFYFAQRKDSRVLAQKFWTEPEHGEMQIYAYHWENMPSEYQDLAKAMKPEECTNLDGQFFLHHHLREAVMSQTTDLRNSVSHRDLLNERSACYSAWNIILCFILMGDHIRAIEVESLLEAFLTKTLQNDALLRLYNASWNENPARRHAIVEVCRRKGIEADHLDSPKRKLFSVSPLPNSGIRSRWPEISKSAKAKWSLTDDEKMELWHSAVHRFVFCDSMHETLMRQRPIE